MAGTTSTETPSTGTETETPASGTDESFSTFTVSAGADRTTKIGDAVDFEAAVSGGSGDVSYEWSINRDGPPAYSRDTSGRSAHVTFNASGTYTATVTATDADGREATDSATVTVEESFGDVPTLASGDSVGSPGPIAFAVRAKRGQFVGIAAEGVDGTATLYDPSGDPIRSTDLLADSRMFGATAAEPGTYHVAFDTSEYGSPHATVYVRSPDPQDPDGNASAATHLETDANVTATLSAGDPSDWYALDVGRGPLNATVELTPLAVNQNDVAVQVYDADLHPIGEVTAARAGGSSNRTFANGADALYRAEQGARVSEPGTYYVRVSAVEGDAVGDTPPVNGLVEYTLTVDGTANGSAAAGGAGGGTGNEQTATPSVDTRERTTAPGAGTDERTATSAAESPERTTAAPGPGTTDGGRRSPGTTDRAATPTGSTARGSGSSEATGGGSGTPAPAGGGARSLDVSGGSGSGPPRMDRTAGGAAAGERTHDARIRRPAPGAETTVPPDQRVTAPDAITAAGAGSDQGATLGPVCERCGAPTDPDGDGVYEDVDGDGRVGLRDALTLFDHRGSASVVGHRAAFDVDGNGRLDAFDAIRLVVDAW
ncbi:MAG: PKD domain-containing protein [Salinigranum sp.]